MVRNKNKEGVMLKYFACIIIIKKSIKYSLQKLYSGLYIAKKMLYLYNKNDGNADACINII